MLCQVHQGSRSKRQPVLTPFPMQVSMDCLISRASLLLRHPPTLSAPPPPVLDPLGFGALSEEGGGAHLSGSSTAAEEPQALYTIGSNIATLELDRWVRPGSFRVS